MQERRTCDERQIFPVVIYEDEEFHEKKNAFNYVFISEIKEVRCARLHWVACGLVINLFRLHLSRGSVRPLGHRPAPRTRGNDGITTKFVRQCPRNSVPSKGCIFRLVLSFSDSISGVDIEERHKANNQG